MMMNGLVKTELPFPLVGRGKVRDIYDVSDDRLLIVATDRISAFDVVLPQPIPFKGAVLTQITAWWLERVADITPNHLITADPDEIERLVPALAGHREQWAWRGMLVRRTHVVPIECVVRGYITGSAWKEYRATGTLAGQPLARGLQESQRMEPSIFSPATKAETGHDENITFEHMCELVGTPLAEDLRARSLAIYDRGVEIAKRAGIIIADTKFEFGHLPDKSLILIDEVLTPDSSRFWPGETYAVGRGQPSLDKQPVRDYLEELVAESRWDKAPPAPDLPAEVVQNTAERYRNVYQRLTGATVPGGTAP